MGRAIACLLAGALAGCSCNDVPVSPDPCRVVPDQKPGLPGVVWGFADLHAHPAIEKAFNESLIWGGAIDDHQPVNAAELPRIAACPVETHLLTAKGPIDRAVGGQVFPEVAAIAGYAHAPVATGGLRAAEAWPNARDVIHQQMNVSSIRRAYEGGLRLMFASTTDDQVVAALLNGPNFVDGFVADPTADDASARRQLELIRTIVDRNASWMGIATTPAEARAIIGQGRLALVLSLEMNGLQPGGLETLIAEQNVRHVIPIHLIDNDIGGSAANSPLFNSASAAVSALYRKDKLQMQFMDVIATARFAPSLFWPKALVTATPVPVYVGLDDVPYQEYASLCYEPLSNCQNAVPTPSSYVAFGQQNLRGLCSSAEECLSGERPGADRIRGLMDAGVLIDISHMGARSAAETAALHPTYPLIASHGDVAHLCDGLPTKPPCVDSTTDPQTERALNAEVARAIVRRKGVLGLGTGLGVYGTQPLMAVRGGPVLAFAPGRARGCVARTSADGCLPAAPVDQLDAGIPIDVLRVETVGGITATTGNAQPFVRVTLRDRVAGALDYQRQVVSAPFQCSMLGCVTEVALGHRNGPGLPQLSCSALSCSDALSCDPGASYTVDDIESVSLEWLYLPCDADCRARAGTDSMKTRQCASTWDSPVAPKWPIDRVDVAVGLGLGPLHPLAQLGETGGAQLATLAGARGAFLAYSRADRPTVRAQVPVSGKLLRLTLTGTPGQSLPGATAQQVGANVCVALRHDTGAGCRGPAEIPAEVKECPSGDGWIPLNQRGQWQGGVSLYAFARTETPSAVCGLDVAILDWEAPSLPFGVDEVLIEAAEDPVGHWIRRYAEVARHVADGQLGAVAFGTDFNGLNGVTDISEFPMPADARAASACPVNGSIAGGSPLPLGPMRFRNGDGSLGSEVRIDERGLATYGQLADLMALIKTYPGCGADVHDSLMLSAEATLRAWEAIATPGMTYASALPRVDFACGTPPGTGP